MDPDIKRELLEAYDARVPVQLIALALGCTTQNVRWHAKQAGKLDRRLRVDLDVRRLLDLYEQGVAVKQIARELRCSERVVKDAVVDAGFWRSRSQSRSHKETMQ